MSSKVITEPVAFEYAGGAGVAFRLVPGGFVALGQSGGYVYGITVASPDGSRPLVDAYAAAVTVDRALTGTRWQRTGGPLPGLEQVRRDLNDPQPGFSETLGLGQ